MMAQVWAEASRLLINNIHKIVLVVMGDLLEFYDWYTNGDVSYKVSFQLSLF